MRGKWEVLHTSGAGVLLLDVYKEFSVTTVKVLLDSSHVLEEEMGWFEVQVW